MKIVSKHVLQRRWQARSYRKEKYEFQASLADTFVSVTYLY